MTSPPLRRARVAVALTFAFNGFLWAAWVPHIPEVKARLGLSDAALGLALLGPAIGSMISMPLVGRATTRFGSGRVTAAMAFGSYLVIAGPGLGRNLPTLFLALALWGLAAGALDVAMNAQAVQVERSYRRPIMSSFHAFWSVGTVLGTAVGSLGAGLSISLARQQASLAVLLALVTCWAAGRFIADHPAEQYQPGGRVFEIRLVLLGIAGVCALLSEGSAGDWSPVYLRDDLHVTAGHAGLAYGAFTVMMTHRPISRRPVRRLAGPGPQPGHRGRDRGDRDGRRPDQRHPARRDARLRLPGTRPVGAGAGVLLHRGGRPGAAGPKLAVVSSFSYLGFLIGPASLGPLASATSVHAALWVLPTFAALAGVLGVIAVRMTTRTQLPSLHCAWELADERRLSVRPVDERLE